MNLTINLATRGRPDLLAETVRRTLACIESPDTLFLISVDRDDKATVDSLAALPSDKRILPLVMDREDSLGEKYNRALVFGPADVYLPMVDYAPHVTPGFDRKILDAAAVFPDGIGVVYNRMANASFPEINGVTHRLAEKMGFIYPPWFPYWFVDHWLDEIAKMIGRISWADVKLDRLKRPGTQDCRDLLFWTVLFDSLHVRRRKCARDIVGGADFKEPPWRKELLLQSGHAKAIQFYSTWVNDGMRRDPKGYEAMGSKGIPDDERYTRVKGRALELMGELIPELQDEQDRLTQEA